MLKNNEIELPDAYILLKCKSLQVFRSRQTRDISVEILKSDLAHKFFNDEFDRILNIYNAYNALTIVESDNDNMVYALREALRAIRGVKSLNGQARKIIYEEIFKVL
jgi:hypothetical protein